MVHLIAHLVKEIYFLSPVFLHQMYGYERFMGVLKLYLRNRALPEGCIAQGYSIEEVVDWCVNYIDPDNPIGVSHSRHEGKLASQGILEKHAITPDPNAYNQTHFLVLQ